MIKMKNPSSGDEAMNEMEDTTQKKHSKKKKPGIIYVATIPPFMNVTKMRELMGKFGEVGRVFLQPESGVTKKKKPAMHFTEGWVEFKSKKVAKTVASMLNNAKIETQKRSKFYDYIWNIKYLPRFKWVHLNERLTYERAVYKQRLRAEIAQAKRETNFFTQNVEFNEKLKRKKRKKGGESGGRNENTDMQHKDREVVKKKTRTEVPSESGDVLEARTDLFRSLLGRIKE